MTWIPCADLKVAEEIKDMGRKVFLALNGDSYARCDLRMDKQGRIFFLEINPYCGIFYAPETPGSADCILKFDPIGARGFLEHLIKCAKLRQRRLIDAQKTAIRFKAGLGYGLYASRDIKAGELIEQFEERPHYLVTKGHVDQTWPDRMKSWFQSYAYPLIGDTYVMWSDKPTDWKPLNHSCEPNTWLVGLNQVARRDIKKHESITIEYATFCADNMKEFDCQCGAVNCRKTIRASDCMLPFVGEQYADHVSDYVKARRGRGAQANANSHHHTLTDGLTRADAAAPPHPPTSK